MKIIFRVLILSFLSFNLHSQEVQFNVGVADLDVDPEIGIPLAGYGSKIRRLPKIDIFNKIPHSFFFKPSTGKRDAIRSKVMIVDNNKEKLLFISLDVIGVTKNFHDDLSKKLKSFGFKKSNIFITGTHTHSGPGTLSRLIPLQLVAVDLYIDKNYQYVLNKVYDSVVVALNRMEPAYVYRSAFDAQGIQKNKFRREDEEWFDKKAQFILAKSVATNQWLGGMLNFAAHGNAMPIEDLRYSADFPGAIERAVERKLAAKNIEELSHAPVILFMNGAEGDVRHNGPRGEEIMEAIAEDFANQANQTALNEENMTQLQPEISAVAEESFIGIASYPLKICFKRDGIFKNWMNYLIPGRATRIPILDLLPRYTELSAAKIGDVTMMSWPGEASTAVGFRLHQMAREMGVKNSWFLGLTNDYMTYFTTKDEFFEAAYDSCSSFYGYKAADRIIEKQRKLIKKL